MIKHPDQRVAVLVDAQNMYHSAKHLHSARLNFGKAVQDAVAGRPLVRAIAYVAKSKTGEETSFFDALVEAKIEPRIKDVQEFSSGAKKADWDVGMAIDAVKLAEKVDVIVLMTGDGDFCPVIEYLHGHGVMVEVVAFGESTNADLRAMADSFVDLSSSRGNLLRAGSKKAQPDLEPKEPAPDKDSTRGTRSVKVTY
ncbi:NYN domain-containing protein [Patescibacteria group bacterium]|nr:NYN domain-containing protein [Patescibacteria group bacterium]MBU1448953.1 NYN domain-containing protein [Patescibacteria group bacterium]MBU2613321.1 NYN domain-containing protein [Patescibacteria group bacterium]